MARDISTAADPASAWLTRFAPLIKPGVRVLEIACGNGRNTRLLAQLDVKVTAVDVNPMPQTWENVEFLKADLERDPWPFAPETLTSLLEFIICGARALPICARV